MPNRKRIKRRIKRPIDPNVKNDDLGFMKTGANMSPTDVMKGFLNTLEIHLPDRNHQ
jgi:hypothetical protein